MKKKYLMVLIMILICGLVSACSIKKITGDSTEDQDVIMITMSELKGEVTKVIDENTVLVKYTQEGDATVKVGEILKVTYNTTGLYNMDESGNIYYDISEGKTVIKVGDKVTSSFNAEEISIVNKEKIVNVNCLAINIMKSGKVANCRIEKVSTSYVELVVLKDGNGLSKGDVLNFNLKGEYVKYIDDYKLKENDNVNIMYFDYSKIYSGCDDFLFKIYKN